MDRVEIAHRWIGEGQPCFTIAEAGVNHNEDVERAKEHIRQAARAGADAIKFQTYQADRLVTRTAPKYWHVHVEGEGETQYETFAKLDGLPRDAYVELVKEASRQGIILFSTPFDLEAVDFLEEVETPAYKIASADITYPQLLRRVARTGRPIILSTGTSRLGEIEEALQVISAEGNDQVILLHCTLSYPTAFRDANLRMMLSMKAAFPQHPIGLSDHTLGDVVPVAAAALGAVAIEKHFTIDKSLPDSPDHALGLDPDEFATMAKRIRAAEASLGRWEKLPVAAEEEALRLARRSLVAARDIPRGTRITSEMLICKRPGTGIPPKFEQIVVGRTATRDIREDEVLQWEML